MFSVVFHKKVLQEDLRKIDTFSLRVIQKMIHSKLKKDPFLYGKPLRKSLVGLRSLRVGNYRVIYKIQNKEIKIYVMVIAKRSIVYDLAEKRMN
ncbi:type II toxin-antitoxin system RelE/ParE family toxin [Candidatus Gracilibacteria bacterium]|nr:type II toxin-antitoxin system RelE/ParE family toxin [Candidatus Gracilibacteria bacterium]